MVKTIEEKSFQGDVTKFDEDQSERRASMANSHYRSNSSLNDGFPETVKSSFD